MHESSLHDRNCFITLTYDDVAYVPVLIYHHFQDFLKRLRRRGFKFSFYMAGEYGAKLGRPHFHALLFGVDFPDRFLIRQGDNPLYGSKILDKTWGKGFTSIGAVTFESAAYIARYCTAKVTGDLAEAHYVLPRPFIDKDTGEIFTHRPPEFNHMSLANPIGRDWLRLYWTDARKGRIVVNGKECNIPRYYRNYFRNSSHGEAIKCAAAVEGLARRFDNTPARLLVKETVTQSRFSSLSRSL